MSSIIIKIYSYLSNITNDSRKTINDAYGSKPYNMYKKITTYLGIGLFSLILVSLTYRYVQYNQNYTPVEATILEHQWTDGNRLVLRYQYEVGGESYDGHSGSYGEAEYGGHGKFGRGLKRKSAQHMQISYPIGSKRTVYYEKGMPETSYFETSW